MSNIRLTGMASGLDTDQMVKDLMKVERMKLDRVLQNKELAVWRQEKYKEITQKLQELQSSFFDVTNPTKNLRSTSMFGQFTSKIQSNGADVTAVSASGTANLKNANITIDEITKLATKDKWVGADTNLQGITTSGLDLTAAKANANGVNFLLTIDNSTKEIHLTQAEISGFTTETELKDALNTKISEAFGTDFNDVVTESGGELTFEKAGNRIVLLAKTGQESSLTELGIAASGTASDGFKTKSLSTLFGLADGDLSGLSINGVTDFGISSSDDIYEAIDKINKSKANVKITYDSLSDKFTMESTKEGSANNIVLDNADTTNFLSNLGITDGAGRTKGENAQLSINGTTITKESNTFNFDGAVITLNETHTTGTPIELSFEVNKEPIKENLKEFVKKYNELIKEFNGLVKEKRNYDYKPLTSTQRKELSDDEAKNWDIKAKSGIVSGASDIQSLLTSLRKAFYEPIEGLDISLKDIGITSSKSYLDNGKLEIDDAKLDEALENNYENVVKLFTQESDETYAKGDRSVRYNETGIGNRINDILSDYVRISRDTEGKKGVFIEKAGIVGTTLGSDLISKEITSFNERIADIEEYLTSRENSYYQRFAAMESALQQLQSQSNWIGQNMGG